MKALVLTQYNEFDLQDLPRPQPGPDEVLIRVQAVGICGSDVHGMDGSTGRRVPPIVMGHEASGIIAEVGPQVRGWSVGDRVTFDSTVYKLDDWYSRRGMYNLSDGREVVGVSTGTPDRPGFKRNGAFAEYVVVPQHILYAIPEGVSFTQAALVEPVAVALHALSVTPIQVNDTAVVVGAGMIGLFVIQALKLAGCGQIIAIDLADERLELAQKLGATHTLRADAGNVPDQVRGLTHGRGADISFEVVGISPAVQTAIACVRRGGTVTLVGNLSPTIEIPLQTIVTGQIRLQGSCAINGEYEAALDLIASGRIDVMAILSAEAPLAEGADWFRRLYDKEKGLIKVVLKP
ncbi:Alcohol dehydrogenase zinc-binding domain protein [Fibrella aestuarina BUZ 2]|uniref:Alcohol dehydrogenase zinc-binding domain protein n=1 Tax=Fibrella aestuarina BUZ 2 TaxID=1166018 RepID=I0KG19_9BACT|nr:galactitol-1-phosphate 5-dehydrogenase [Fibrella aestuarina]CCH03072.1 Alcohol dehydrogenase zinc-binding domain protein [Fibrella aestuarina BUZ 2]